MSEPAHDSEPVRIPDHNLDDLVATVTELVTESRKQGETLARLTEEQPPQQDSEHDEPVHTEETTPAPAGSDAAAPRRKGRPPSSSSRSTARRTPRNSPR